MLVSSEPDVHIHVYTCVFSGLRIIIYNIFYMCMVGRGGWRRHTRRESGKQVFILYCDHLAVYTLIVL